MSVYAIADLHLPGKAGDAKSMAVFDPVWEHAQDKLLKNWTSVVGPDDTVVIPGDISWAMSLDEALDDFAFIDSLPGHKLIGKGNHDFWWATATRMKSFFVKNGFGSLDILYNNSYCIDGTVLCGTRGWFPDPLFQKTVNETDWDKIARREAIRLRTSIESADRNHPDCVKTVFLHFPPVWRDIVCREILDVLHEYGIGTCWFGHIHGVYGSSGDFGYEGIRFGMVSADHLDFVPRKVL